MDLRIWAHLNLVGNVSYSDYLNMSPTEAEACLEALNSAIEETKEQQRKSLEEQKQKERMSNTLASMEDKFKNFKHNKGISH